MLAGASAYRLCRRGFVDRHSSLPDSLGTCVFFTPPLILEIKIRVPLYFKNFKLSLSNLGKVTPKIWQLADNWTLHFISPNHWWKYILTLPLFDTVKKGYILFSPPSRGWHQHNSHGHIRTWLRGASLGPNSPFDCPHSVRHVNWRSSSRKHGKGVSRNSLDS